MSRVFHAGQQLISSDLKVQFRNSLGLLVDPAEISYALVDKTQGFDIVIDNIIDRTPVRESVGTWFADYKIKDDATPGEYEIRWSLKETVQSSVNSYSECYHVVKDSTITKRQYPEAIESMLMKLRVRLADDDPDRNYRFAAPVSSAEVNTFTTNHGFLWQDFELLSFMDEAVDKLNWYMRETSFSLASIPTGLRPFIVDSAALFALEHMSLRWIQDEFGYSLNGISLDLSKSDKYDRMMQYYKDKVETDLKHIEEHRSHVIKGLRQTPFSHGYGHRAHYGYRGGAGGSWRRGR